MKIRLWASLLVAVVAAAALWTGPLVASALPSAAGALSVALPIVKGYLPPSSGPQVQNLALVTASPVKYAKAEWTFDLSKAYANPYYFYDPADTPSANPTTMTWFGRDGISVDMHLASPSGATIAVPAFWAEGYLRVNASNLEVLGRSDPGRWHVRFSPSEAGTYTYYLTAEDASGTGRYPSSGSLSFVAGNSAGKGFIRASSQDSRFLQYDTGQAYVPIAAGHQWWNDQGLKSYDYESAFSTFGQNGVNLVRVWDQADFALSVEGAQPVWARQGTSYGPAQGVEIGTANVHSGLRAARPVSGNGWYQRLAVSQPSQQHQLSAWIRTDNLAGGQTGVSVTGGLQFNSGSALGQLAPVSGTTGWTRYTATFTPGSQTVSINLYSTATSGSMYVDEVSFGPVDGNGSLIYNLVSDPGMERHFSKDNPNNDPNADPTLARPLGNYFNQWAAYELDKIVESAETNGVGIQLASASGPWFTWPDHTDADWSQPWVLKSWERNFRYRVARWGYSPSVLAWEMFNEHGHIPAGSDLYNFYQAYGSYQASVDPYRHLRTTSQGSQAFSPGAWSSGAFDLANYHDYMMSSRYPAALTNDEANFVYKYAWCLRDPSSYCGGLAGDGSSWSGSAKPFVWGEIGVGTTTWDVANLAGTQGEGGRRALHNEMWAGLFSPLGTTPIDWYWQQEDSFATTKKFAERKIASQFFAGMDYPGARFTYLMTASDSPTGYAGETVATSDARARVLAMRSADQSSAYLWVQHRDHTWFNAPAVPTPISPTVTIGQLLNRAYTVEIWNIYTGALISSTQQTTTGGALSISVGSLTDDVAIKIR